MARRYDSYEAWRNDQPSDTSKIGDWVRSMPELDDVQVIPERRSAAPDTSIIYKITENAAVGPVYRDRRSRTADPIDDAAEEAEHQRWRALLVRENNVTYGDLYDVMANSRTKPLQLLATSWTMRSVSCAVNLRSYVPNCSMPFAALKGTVMPDDATIRLSTEEMQHVLAISRAVSAARRRPPSSRARIAESLFTFGFALVDGDPVASDVLHKRLRQIVDDLIHA
jgi:hypothetical protein